MNNRVGTIVRTILQILVYINQCVALFAKTSLSSSVAYQWISFALTVAITAISYWYNNDWTSAAKTAREVYDILKDGKVTKDEVAEFINKHKNKETVDSVTIHKKE